MPRDVPRDERGLSYGPAWDAWIAALEAANDACWDDWHAEHFDPVLGYEPHTLLIEAADVGGGRHFLDGRPVHAGSTLELLLADGHWVTGRYEWGLEEGGAPIFHLLLGGPDQAQSEPKAAGTSQPAERRPLVWHLRTGSPRLRGE